jgi:hypothetical protein
VAHNVFDATVMMFRPCGFTLLGNYFGAGFVATGLSDDWARFEWNFIRTTGTTDGAVVTPGNTRNSYLFLDMQHGNPRGFYMPTSHSYTHSGWVIGHGGDTNDYPDSGEFLALGGGDASVGATWSMNDTIMLPNARGYSSWEMMGIVGTLLTLRPNLTHNTWFGGFQGTGAVSSMLQINEGGNNAWHQITAFKSNLIWNPMLEGYIPPNLYKIYNQNVAAPQTDVCDPLACDHNGGWNITAKSGHPANTNEGKGYASKWSVTPGAHDVDGNPGFIDYQRTVELFDSKYLGNNPTAWTSGATYSVGQFVSHSRADVYWGLPVNYRYTDGTGCSAANPEPGNGDAWRKCWEWASLYRIREALATNQLRDDQVIGLHGEDVITAVIKWIRAGYAPTNPAFMGAAHDGDDIGAVPVVFLPPNSGGTN